MWNYFFKTNLLTKELLKISILWTEIMVVQKHTFSILWHSIVCFCSFAFSVHKLISPTKVPNHSKEVHLFKIETFCCVDHFLLHSSQCWPQWQINCLSYSCFIIKVHQWSSGGKMCLQNVSSTGHVLLAHQCSSYMAIQKQIRKLRLLYFRWV